MLLRFADERLATASADAANTDLLPVPLRSGDRVMGGVLSWATPQGLRAFPDGSPFRGLAVPPDVTVSRQVLAEPSADLPQRTWAALTDGTPLVTAKPIGAGESVLFHVPARSEWSNLPLSGLFVDMLRRIIDLSRGAPQQGAGFEHLPPLAALDGFGDEQKPGSAAQPLEAGEAAVLSAGPQHPPGLYGTGGFNRAFNLGTALGQPQALNMPMETPQASAARPI